MRMEYNETYNERVHKYTINIPIESYKKLVIRSKQSGVLRVSIYLRALIEREINKPELLNAEDIILMRKESHRVASAEHRRIFLDNIPKTSFQKTVKKFLDIFSDKQYTLFK